MIFYIILLMILEIFPIVAGFLFSISIHEFSHALVAYLLGDDTAKRLGRLTLNPLAHIDLIGLLCLIFFKIGWARPVPINIRNFRYPKWYGVLTGLAGPAANLASAAVVLFILKFFLIVYPEQSYIMRLINWTARANVMLGVFNLLPIPPLDGSHILFALVPHGWEQVYYRFQAISIIFLLLLLMTPQFTSMLRYAFQTVFSTLESVIL